MECARAAFAAPGRLRLGHPAPRRAVCAASTASTRASRRSSRASWPTSRRAMTRRANARGSRPWTASPWARSSASTPATGREAAPPAGRPRRPRPPARQAAGRGVHPLRPRRGYRELTLWTQRQLEGRARIYERAGFELVEAEPPTEQFGTPQPPRPGGSCSDSGFVGTRRGARTSVSEPGARHLMRALGRRFAPGRFDNDRGWSACERVAEYGSEWHAARAPPGARARLALARVVTWPYPGAGSGGPDTTAGTRPASGGCRPRRGRTRAGARRACRSGAARAAARRARAAAAAGRAARPATAAADVPARYGSTITTSLPVASARSAPPGNGRTVEV